MTLRVLTINKTLIALLIIGTLLFSALFPTSSAVSAQAGNVTDPDGNLVVDRVADAGALPTDQIIIKYKDDYIANDRVLPDSQGQQQRLSHAAGIAVSYVRSMDSLSHVLRLPTKMSATALQVIIDHLRALPEVEYAEADLIMQAFMTPNDPYYAQQWHYVAPTAGNYGINAPAGWDITTGSASVVVAVVDTGYTDHPEFSGRIVPGYDFITELAVANDGDGRDGDAHDPGDWVARNECGPGTSPSESSWHGTHTAGTIGANSNNGTGVAGINWNAKILPVRVLGKCGGYMSDIVDGMKWAAGLSVTGVPANANPAKVINVSLGGGGTCDTTTQTAINQIVAAGTTIVVSAGNSNANASLFTPANCNNVVTVAATTRSGSRASYSNYGSVVEISAPGGDGNYTDWVLSTWNDGATTPGNSVYAWMAGTSMSAPHVSGVASLLYSKNPSLTPAQILHYLQTSATTFPAGSTCSTSTCGSGIVNAGAALSLTPTSVELASFTATSGKNVVVLNWETAQETKNLGFNIYQAAKVDGVRIQLNSGLIPSANPGAPYGATYEFRDETVKGKRIYYYWLEDVDIYGNRELHGPVTGKALTK